MDVFTVEGRVRSFSKLQWPPLKDSQYTLVNAEKMAMAGFYCRPLTGSPDNVCCFACSKNLDGWQPMDEAWTEHMAHGKNICFLVNLHVEGNRVETFRASRWPHSTPTSEQMAAAGFFYYPRSNGDDTAFCFQCGLALDGWESTDDPWHEHGRRRPLCPYICNKVFVEPAAFQRILGSSSQPYVKEMNPPPPPTILKDMSTTATTTTKPVITTTTTASTSTTTLTIPKKEKEEDIKENKKAKTNESDKKMIVEPKFIKPQLMRQTIDTQKLQEEEEEEEEADTAMFLADLIDKNNAFIQESDLTLTVEDFVKELIHRQLVSFDNDSHNINNNNNNNRT